MGSLLLDTCTLIFMTQRARLAPAATELLQAASAAGGGSTYISPITAWEVGMPRTAGCNC